MNKTLRNKAYANSEFFICDWHGADWLTNTYIAEPDTTAPRITKSCSWRDTQGQKPLLGKLVDITKHHIEMDKITRTDDGVLLEGKGKKNLIQAVFYDYFLNRYPDAIFKTGNTHRYEPITIYSNDKLIGIVMPLTQ